MPNWVPLNWDLMKNPTNWVIVTLMVLIAAMAFHIVAQLAPSSTVTKDSD